MTAKSKKFLLLMFGLVFVSGSALAGASDTDLFYKMNETSGPVLDWSPNGNDGSVVGSPNFRVDGASAGDDPYGIGFTSSDMIDTGATNLLEGDSDFTLSTWINPDAVVGDTANGIPENRLISKAETSGSNSWVFSYEADPPETPTGVLTSRCTVLSGGTRYNLFFNMSNYVNVGSYSHVACRYDSGNISLYVDGEHKISNNTEAGIIDSTVSPVSINGRSSEGDFGFNGYQDEVKLFDQALNSTEINKLYTNNDITDSSDTGGDSGDSTDNKLVNNLLKLHFNESSGSTTFDYSGYSNDGAWQGSLGTGFEGVNLFDGLAYEFTDNQTNYVEVPHSSELDLSPPYSISAWVNPDSVFEDREKVILAHKDTSGRVDTGEGIIALYLKDQDPANPCNNANREAWSEEPVLLIGDGSSRNYYCSGFNISSGTWNMITVSQYGGDIHWYRNYSLVTESNSIDFSPDTQEGWSVGMHLNGDGSTVQGYEGLMDEFNLYNESVNSTEVSNLYSTGTISDSSDTGSEDLSLTVDAPANRTYQYSDIGVSGSTNTEANISYKVDGGSFQSIGDNITSFSSGDEFAVGDHSVTVKAVKYDNSSQVVEKHFEFSVQRNWIVDSQSLWNEFAESVSNLDITEDEVKVSSGSTQGTYESVVRDMKNSLDYQSLQFDTDSWIEWEHQVDFGSEKYLDPTPFYAHDREYEIWLTVLEMDDGTTNSYKCDPDTMDCSDDSNYQLVDDAVETGGGSGTNMQWGQYVNGTFHIWRTVNDGDMAKYKCSATITAENCMDQGVVIQGADGGGYYNYDTDRWHVIAEGSSYQDYPDSQNLTFRASTNASGLEYTEPRVIFDTSDKDWMTGDPDFVRFRNSTGHVDQVYGFTDRKPNTDGDYYIQLIKAPGMNKTFESVEQITHSTGGDLETIYVPQRGEFLGFTEYDTSDNGVGIRTSPGTLGDTVEAKLEYDTNDDGTLDESIGYQTLDAEYSRLEQDSTLLREDISLDGEINSSYSQKVSVRLTDNEANDYPEISGFELTNSSLQDITAPSLTIHSPTNSTISDSSPDLNVTSSEAANFTWNVDGGSNQTSIEDDTDLNTSLTGLSDGGHTVNVWAEDSAGNVGSSSVSFTVDTTPQDDPPTVDLSLNSTSIFENESVEATVTATDDFQVDSVALDWTGDGTYEVNESGSSLTATKQFQSTGLYSVTARAQDNASQTSTDSVSLEVQEAITATNKSIIPTCGNATSEDAFCITNTTNSVTFENGFTPDDNTTVAMEVDPRVQTGEFTFFGFANATGEYNSLVESTKYDVFVQEPGANETNDVPTADFDIDATNLDVDVDASASSDPDGSIVEYRWDWTNDGNFEDTGETQSHTYPSAGEYTIVLEVEDDDGATDTLEKTVSLTEDTNGGGAPPGEDDNETETPTVTVDGSSLSLKAPHRGARYGEGSAVVVENETRTLLVNNEEVTIEVLSVDNSREAEIIVGSDQMEVSEREEFEVDRDTFGVIGSLYVADIVATNTTSKVYFSIEGEPNPTAPVPFGYQYEINQSGSITIEYKKTGVGNDWQTATQTTFTESVASNYTEYYQDLGPGIYEVRGILDSNGEAVMTEPTGVYVGEVPYLNITNPEPGRVFREVANGNGGYTVPLAFKAATVNQTKFSLYYSRNNTAYLGATNVQITDESGLVDSFFESLDNLDYVADWFSYEWQNVNVIAPTDVTFTGSADVTVPGTGDYTGYVNASSNYSELFEPWNATSIGVPITIQTESVENVSDSEVIDTFNPENDQIAKPPGSDPSFNESVNNNTFENPQWRLVEPDQNAEIESPRLDELVVDFSMLMGYEGTAAVNKSLVVRNPDNETVEVELNPSDSSYDDISVEASRWGDEWEEGQYDWWLEYEYNETTIYSTENSTNGQAQFTVNLDRTPRQSYIYFFDQLKEALANYLDTSKALAGTFIILLIVLPTYVAARYFTGDAMVAKLTAGTVYAALAWVQLAPQMLNLIIMLVLILYVVGKFTLWVVG